MSEPGIAILAVLAFALYGPRGWIFRLHAGHPLRLWFEGWNYLPTIKTRYNHGYRSVTLRRGPVYVYHRAFEYPPLLMRHVRFRDRLAETTAKALAFN